MIELVEWLLFLWLVALVVGAVVRVGLDVFSSDHILPEQETAAMRAPGGWIELGIKRLATTIRLHSKGNRQVSS